MANAREIQNRIKSIQDTRKITNAMYLISSTKLKKSKKLLEDTEPYFYTLQSLIRRIILILTPEKRSKKRTVSVAWESLQVIRVWQVLITTMY